MASSGESSAVGVMVVPDAADGEVAAADAGRSAGEGEETEEKGEGGGEGEKEDEEDEEDEEEEVNVRSSGGRGGSTPFIRFVFWLFFFFAGIGWAVDVGLVIPSHAVGGLSGAVANAEFSAGGSPVSAIEETPLHRGSSAPTLANPENDNVNPAVEPTIEGEESTIEGEEPMAEKEETDIEGEEPIVEEEEPNIKVEEPTADLQFTIDSVVLGRDPPLLERGLDFVVSVVARAAKFARVYSLATDSAAGDSCSYSGNSDGDSSSSSSSSNSNSNSNNSNPVVRAFNSWTARNKAAAEALVDGAWV
eukprot:jgi/Undpi1/4325/HiC_scaffold_17.g07691.m1